MKIYPVGAELFYADKREDRLADRHDDANSHFSQFGESAKKLMKVISNLVPVNEQSYKMERFDFEVQRKKKLFHSVKIENN